jgi:hypothetical protein
MVVTSKAFLDQYNQVVAPLTNALEASGAIIKFKDELFFFLDKNYELYLSASPEERNEIRKIVKRYLNINETRFLDLFLFSYMQRAIESIERTGEKIWLTRGLVACSIENGIWDQRDNTNYLSLLYIAAEEKSLYPKPEFQAVSEISSDEVSSGGNVSMSELMKNIPNISHMEYENWKEYS